MYEHTRETVGPLRYRGVATVRGLEGRAALVTGAAGGIGRAAALRLAEEGARVVAADLRLESLGDLERELRERTDAAMAIALDVRDAEAVDTAVEEVAANHGGIHVLVNAHGVYHQGKDGEGPIQADTPAHWQSMLDVNLLGVVNTTRAVLPSMKHQRHGRIVTLSSAAGVVGGYACSAAYAASKAAVACFMKCAAREGAAYGVTANSVAPGQIDTAMTEVVMTRVPLQSIVERTPLGRLGDPSEVAAAIAFLASDDASFITGQVMGVNGGMVMV